MRRRRSWPAGTGAAIAAAAVVLAVVVGVSQLARPSAGSSRVAPAPRSAAPAGPAAGAAQVALARHAQQLVDVAPAELGYRLVVRGPRMGVRGTTDRTARTITLSIDERQAAHRR